MLGNAVRAVPIAHHRERVVQSQRGVERRQQGFRQRLRVRQTQRQHVAVAPRQPGGGVFAGTQQRLHRVEQARSVARRQRSHAPGQLGPAHLHRGMLEFGLLRDRVEQRQGERVDAQPAHEARAPVHRQEALSGAHAGAGLDRDHHFAAPAFHAHQVARLQPPQFEITWVHRQQRLVGMGEQPRHAAAAAHRVPLITQTAGIEVQRIARVDRLGHRFVRRGVETRAAVRGRVDPVGVQAGAARRRACGKRPLLRAGIEQRIR